MWRNLMTYLIYTRYRNVWKYGISRGLFGKVITFYVDQSDRFSVFPYISIFLPHFLGMQAFQTYNISLEVHHKEVLV